VFLRLGDGASSFDLKSIVIPPLSDGTKIQINLSYDSRKSKKWDDGKTFKWKIEPIKRHWLVSVSVRDESKRRGQLYIVNDWIVTEDSEHVRQVIRKIFAGKNRMVGVWMKRRKYIISKWLRDS
jgi:hypothetical protein